MYLLLPFEDHFMNKSIYPKKLKQGDHIRVIAPARSMSFIDQETQSNALAMLKKLGFNVSFSENVKEMDDFNSSSIHSRVQDLHEAFADRAVDAILTTIGGYNSNQLISELDYELIQNNPKILCGFSDITALSNAIYTKTGLVTYTGPHFSTFGMLKGLEFTIDSFLACLCNADQFEAAVPDKWSDDLWFVNQQERTFIKNEGYWVINSLNSSIKGTVVGGNQNALSSLQGTKYWPELSGKIILLEDTADCNVEFFERRLVSLIQQSNFINVQAILIGRFQKGSNVTKDMLTQAVRNRKELANIPVIANVDFGHTTPILTLPIGGEIELSKRNKEVTIQVISH